MDPNETLRLLRAAVTGWIESGGEDFDYGDDMAELFSVMDDWITKGGHLPIDWVSMGARYSEQDLERLETER